MATHPYRQKVATAPYPIHEFDAASENSRSGSENAFVSASASILKQENSPLDLASQISNRLSSTVILSPRFSGKPSSAGAQVPYPTYEHDVEKNLGVALPNSNPLSALSSVTNLNLNLHPGQPMANVLYSQSENNLPGAMHLKYTHTRSVSSTLSILLDRDNLSLIDLNQSVLQHHLGSNAANLMPRMKTIEMYRKNAKKSTDPAVLFQYAQYMLQTALMLEPSTPTGSGGSTPKKTPPRQALGVEMEKSHRKSRLANSLVLENATMSDHKLKQSLLKEAHHYLKRLADKGYVEAQYLLGDAYSSGAFGKVDNKEAFLLFLLAAKHGHAECAFRTAHCYEEGLGTGRDARKGVEFLKLAASKNHPAAMYKLGMYSFYTRMGMPDDIATKKMGIKWLERALNVATELTAAAPYELGRIYQEGFLDILLKDEKYALELYAQAAALGHNESAAILGRCYEIGDIVPQEPNLSIHYYTMAALGGHAELMLAMCAWYLVGSEPYLPKDDEEAFEWAKRAAQYGLAKAQFAVANFYDKGIGCMKNTAEAQDWYRKAAENGEEKALARITNKELAQQLTKDMKKKPRKASGKKLDLAAQQKDCVIM